MFQVNALGKACPLPVIETRKALKEHDAVQTLVDNKIATENLQKMARQLGYSYSMTEDGPAHYTVVITKGEQTAAVPAPAAPSPAVKDDSYIVVINSPTMGTGDESFGRTLLKNFIYTLKEQDVLPDMMIFYNGGVPLVTDTSDSLAERAGCSRRADLCLRGLPQLLRPDGKGSRRGNHQPLPHH